jgi:hypothetical protein
MNAQKLSENIADFADKYNLACEKSGFDQAFLPSLRNLDVRYLHMRVTSWTFIVNSYKVVSHHLLDSNIN